MQKQLNLKIIDFVTWKNKSAT